MPVIIVCDQPAELTRLQSLSGEAGLPRALCFNHPAAALDWCDVHTPDLMLVDHLMRATDGLEFTRRVRARPRLREVPLILMLHDEFAPICGAALALGVTDTLRKPFDPAEFRSRTTNLLALHRARRALEPAVGIVPVPAPLRRNVANLRVH